MNTGGTRVDVRPLKDLARRLPASSVFRVAFLAEDDFMDAAEYTCKIRVWMKLLDEVDGPDPLSGQRWR
jgi:hypothetical protein